MRPSNMTRTRSERARISLSSAETRSTARPLSRSATSRSWMNSVAPMSRPRVGCSAISTGASCDSSRATTTFCRLPPESVPTATRSLAMRIAVTANERARPLREGGRNDEGGRARAGAARWKPMARLSAALGRERRADGGAILRNIGEAGGSMRRDIGCAHIDAADLDPAAVRAPQADERLDEFVLAVARDARDPDDFAGANGQAALGRRAAAPPAPATVRSTASRSGAPTCAGPFVDVQIDVAPGHRADDFARASSRPSLIRCDHAAVAQDRHAIGDRHHLVAACG